MKYEQEVHKVARSLTTNLKVLQPEKVMNFQKAYAILGISSSSYLEEGKKNYRRLSQINHPDKGGNEKKMKEINTAWKLVKKTLKAAPKPAPEAKKKVDRIAEINAHGALMEEKLISGEYNIFQVIDSWIAFHKNR